MSISFYPDGIIYESTLLVIICNATVPSVVDTNVSATVTWTGPNGIVNTDGRITVGQAVSVDDNEFQSILTFRPFNKGDTDRVTNDAGRYTCEMIVSSSTESLVLSGTNSITTREISFTGIQIIM